MKLLATYQAPMAFYQISNFTTFSIFLFVKWTQKTGGEKGISRETKGKNVTPQTCLLHWGFDIIQHSTSRDVILVCKGSIRKA